MVAIDQLYPLVAEARQIGLALNILDAGGTIISMTIRDPNAPPSAQLALVQTEGITYPPQMVEAIKTALRTRQDQINGELAALGVGGAR